MDEEIRQPFEGWETVGELGAGSGRYELRRTNTDGTEERAELLICRMDKDSEEAIRTAKKLASELSAQQKLQGCEHIVTYQEFKAEKNEEDTGGVIYIRRECLTPLAEYCRENGVDETLVLRLGIDISRALMECEALGINHGNIRPRNIYITEDGFFKLGGFGGAAAREVIDCGAEACAYMAPEMFHGQMWDNRADVYSLGMVLYWLLNRCRGAFLPQPPEPVTQELIEQALRRRMGGEHIPAARFGGRVLQNAVLRACEFNPRERYSSAEQLMNALQRLPQRRSDPYAPPVEDEEPEPMPEKSAEEPENSEISNQDEEDAAVTEYTEEVSEDSGETEYGEPEEEPESRIPYLRTATEESKGPNSGGFDLSRSKPVWRPRPAAPKEESEEQPQPMSFRDAMQRNMANGSEREQHAEDFYDDAYREYDDEPYEEYDEAYEEYDELNEDYDGEYEPESKPEPANAKPGKLLLIGVISAGIIFLASLGYLIYRIFG